MGTTERTIRVHYPRLEGSLAGGRLVLRTELDWGRDVEPVAVEADGTCHVFRLRFDRPYLYFKAVWRRGDDVRWAVSDNMHVLAAFEEHAREVYPYFDAPRTCSAQAKYALPSRDGSRTHELRVFLPPGYAENTLHRYPVLYMQDAQNLFFHGESHGGESWRVRETLSRLTEMNVTTEVIVVGIYPLDRETDYTKPGYEAYGRWLVEDLKPRVDADLRTLAGPETTAVMGSSLGGVVSFYLAWQHPQVFGMAGCMSSTFGFKDDLMERIQSEERRDIRLYLDSGWPRDNFEATRTVAALLFQKGWRFGDDLLYLSFPEGTHHEASWAVRCHIPFQFFFGPRFQVARIPTPSPAGPRPRARTAGKSPRAR